MLKNISAYRLPLMSCVAIFEYKIYCSYTGYQVKKICGEYFVASQIVFTIIVGSLYQIFEKVDLWHLETRNLNFV
ncbi:hypothetical protein ES703_32276 [subsurface metagenome]